MTIEQLKEEIDAEVNTNGQRLITGAKMNKVLKDTVDTFDEITQGISESTPFVVKITSSTVSDEFMQDIEQALADGESVQIHYKPTSRHIVAQYVGHDRIMVNNASVVVYVFSSAEMLEFNNGTTPSSYHYVLQVVESASPHTVIIRKVTSNDITTEIINI